MRKGVLIALLIPAALACASDAADVDAPHEIVGRVVDERDGHGISEANVHFSSDTLDEADASSDSGGHFKLAVQLRDGVDYGIVVASHAGYESSPAHSVFFDDSAHVLTLSLQAAPSSK
jgi:hypothetical protein